MHARAIIAAILSSLLVGASFGALTATADEAPQLDEATSTAAAAIAPTTARAKGDDGSSAEAIRDAFEEAERGPSPHAPSPDTTNPDASDTTAAQPRGSASTASSEPARRVRAPALPDATFASPPRYRALKDVVQGIAYEPNLNGCVLGVSAIDLATGERILGVNDSLPMNPASNVKLFTTAAALDRFGPAHRIKTEFATDRFPPDGILTAPLYIKGYGDPALVSERLASLAAELRLNGVTKLTSGIIVDDTHFDGGEMNPAWDRERRLSQAYLALYSATSFNHNAVGVTVLPNSSEFGKPLVLLEPPSPYFDLKSTATTAGRRTALRVATKAAKGKTIVEVSGNISPTSAPVREYYKVWHPALAFGNAIRHALEQRGVEVKGNVTVGRMPAKAQIFYTWRSPPLSDLIASVNKYSNNFVAEQLLKILGADVYAAPGDWKKGLTAVGEFLTRTGIPTSDYTMLNGSGLSDFNRFSAATFTHLLAAMHRRTDLYPEYAASLPIAGADGTLRRRMTDLAPLGRMRAKTGSLDGVSALAGYTHAPDGRAIAFSIMLAHEKLPYRDAVDAIDRIAIAISTIGPEAPISRRDD